MKTGLPGPRQWLSLALPGLLLFLLVQGILTAGVWFNGFGEFSGPDPYMRLFRVLECRGGWGCPGGLVTASNVPYGVILHWPFLLDWIILALSAPLLPFTDFPTAVVVAGYLVGPLFGVGAILTLVSIARTILPDSTVRWVPVLASVHYWALIGFAPTRPDHHGLQILLFLVALLGVLRFIVNGRQVSGPWVAGVGMGLAIWVSPEGLASTGPLIGFLSLVWVVKGGPYLSMGFVRMWWAMVLILGLGLVLDGPQPDRWAAEFDRLSIVHLTAFTLGAAFWTAMNRFPPKKPGGRIFAALLSVGVAGLLLVVLFPGLERGPLAEMPPELATLFLDQVVEFLPAWRFGSTWILLALGPGLAGILAAGLLSLKPRGHGWLARIRRSEASRLGWALILGLLVWFSWFAAFEQIRWTHYIHVLAPLGLTALLAWLLLAIRGSNVRGALKAGGISGVVGLFLLWPFVLLALPSLGGTPLPNVSGCSRDPVLSALGEVPRSRDRPLRVLSTLFWGPELMFRGGVEVVAGPYFRNSSGMLDSHAVMSATELDEVPAPLVEREIDLIVICRTEDWVPLVPADSAETLYHALVEDRPPPWLRPVGRLDETVDFRIFEVVGEQPGG